MVSQHQRKPLFLLGENDGFLGTRDFVKPTADIDFDVKSGNLRSRTTERMVTWELIFFGMWEVKIRGNMPAYFYSVRTPHTGHFGPRFRRENRAKPAFEGT